MRSSKKAIFLVANTAWYLYNFRFPLIKELQKRGYSVTAVSPEDDFTKDLAKVGVGHIGIKIQRSGLNPLSDVMLFLQFLHIYRKHKPDIIQHFTVKPVIYGTIAAHFAGIGHIFNMVPGMGYVFTGVSFKKFWVQKLTRFLYRRALKISSHVFFQNAEDHRYFLKYNLVDDKKTSIVAGTGVDLDKFRPVLNKPPGDKITFVLAARMLWDKGVGEYVKAAYELRMRHKNLIFWLLGPVDLANPSAIPLEQLNAWTSEGIVQYLGMTNDIKKYLEKADVVVLPSFYREGIPLSLLEGAAMGMPIITTDSTGCREVVEEGENGFLVPVKNVEALVAAMEKFIKNPRLIGSMGNTSRKIALQKFDSRNIVNQILKYYPI